MGFYSPATLVKDAQRHGLRVKPVDINCSDWLCTLEEASTTMWDTSSPELVEKQIPRGLKPPRDDKNKGSCDAAEAVPFQSSAGTTHPTLRMGFRYARGLSEEAGTAMVRARGERPFASIADLAHRVPELRRDNLVQLASIGALNCIGCATAKEAQAQLDYPKQKQRLHRRDALWQVERAVRLAGPLLDGIPEVDTASPLAAMTPDERLVADFHGTGLTVGPHPMAYRRAALQRARVLAANELAQVPSGRRVRTAGCVIARQRPGTAKGFVFMSLEDETGISNAILTPDIMERNRVVVTSEKFLLLEGVLQNQDGVISVRVERVAPLREIYETDRVDITDAEVRSHDFH